MLIHHEPRLVLGFQGHFAKIREKNIDRANWPPLLVGFEYQFAMGSCRPLTIFFSARQNLKELAPMTLILTLLFALNLFRTVPKDRRNLPSH
jgi:hypothetical protein